MHIRSGVIGALALLAAGPALATQNTTPALDAPMRPIFAWPGAVGFMTAPTPKDGGRSGVWTWMFLKDAIPSGADTLALEWEIDCAAHTTRVIQQATYRGDTYMATAPGPAGPSAPAAGSPGAIVMGAVCSNASPRAAAVADAATARAAATAMLSAPRPRR